MDSKEKDQLRKEFNEFLDSASNEKIAEFLQFIRERKAAKKIENPEDLSENPNFKNRLN
ncbi:hypothetical protein [Antarcticibacterium arcticum]|uniref:hypothetical protein n=1 Tax=Antarcticibacterium arcticum TaxID=2585771 RepID=UPI00143CD70C|nr:hypothetical protein [Antarcticibacterium arcticum]